MYVDTTEQTEAVSKWVLGSVKRIPAGKRELAETVKGTPGLQMVSRPNGGRSFKYFYQHPETRKTASLTLGPVKLIPDGIDAVVGEPMTIGQAKEIARYARRLVREHRDPKDVLGRLRRDVDAVLSATFDGHKVDDLFREYVANYNYQHGHYARQSTVAYYAARLGLKQDENGEWIATGNGVLSHWSGRIYVDLSGNVKIDAQEADAILMQMTPQMASKTIEALRRFGRWAIYKRRATTNPFEGLASIPEEPRYRRFTDDEIRLLWKITDETNDENARMYGLAAKLSLLTLARIGTVQKARWADFDMEAGIWYVPPTSRNKRQKKKIGRHPIPLSDMAMRLLRSMPQQDEYVFTLDGGKTHLPAKSRVVTNKFRKQMETELGRDYASEPEATEDDWWTGRWHWADLRPSGATELSKLKFGEFTIPQHVIHAIQDHAKDAITAAYIQNNYQDDARKALARWAKHVAGLLKPHS